ncbi:MAG: hypothetical protein AAB897_00135 [Patescibacteria group bacterium]|mgnify:CR=1 FL=1
MQKILVREKEKIPSGRRFSVFVGDGNALDQYSVSLTDSYWERLTSRRISQEELIRRSFEFLLENESKDDILKDFGLPAIQQYFPEFEDKIRASV